MGKHIIELVDLTKEYDGTEALKGINLYIRQNEFVTLLGPSGCGKTTTLRLIGGFEKPTSGAVLFEGANINDMPPYKRRVNTVFQKYALFPHMNVYENIAFGLRIKKTDNAVIREKVAAMLSMVNLEGFEKRSVESLSGGQQQRIAIARALVNEPEVLLLDEPLGALDLKLRKEMQLELKNIQKRLGITFIYVTHDQEEALTMSDTIVVMQQGTIQQIGTPQDIYNEPKNAFVADFIGESNIIDGVMLEDYRVKFAGHVLECVDRGFGSNESVDVVVRPEDIRLIHDNANLLQGRVISVIFKGVHYEMKVSDENGFEWIVHSTSMEPVDTAVALTIQPCDIQIMKKVRTI
ncbi:MAG TPA: spermidine/putrescine ABC transporter ATP-binding protein [Clostridia bacterium]|nr:spermidine/putrescine ABC transporter ATP-binding protein [Clostridia bacterium]